MISKIIGFEINRAFRSKSTYIYFIILFLLAFLFINTVGGAFKAFRIQVSGDNIFINSPTVIDLVLSMFSFLGIFITAGVISNIVYKDYRYDSLSLTFTTGVKKFDFLFGRFAASIVINLFIFLAPTLGIILGCNMPYLNQDLFGEFMPMAYINTYLVRIIPNLFFVSAIFFTLTLLLRNIVVNWFVIIALYVLYAMGGRLISDLDNQTLASIIDPFGLAASLNVTSNFSAEDSNKNVAPLVDVYLWNRLLWTGIGLITLIFGLFRFRFTYDTRSIRIKKIRKNIDTEDTKRTDPAIDTIPEAKQRFGLRHSITAFLTLYKKELKGLLRNTYFILIMIIGVGFLLAASQAIGKIYDTETYPVTYQVIGILGGTFNIFIMIVIILFSGEMVWQARSLKVHETDNILPLKNYHYLGSKIAALVTTIFIMLCILVLTGIAVQAYRGYFNFELGLYAKSVLGLQFSSYILIALLAFFVQVLINHKFLGYAIMIIYYIWDSQFADAVLQNNLYIFGGVPGYIYSDMNGFTEGMWVVMLYKLYWFAFAAILTLIANKFIVRGTEDNIKMRWISFKHSINRSKYTVTGLVGVFLICGGFIFYNTNIAKDSKRSYTIEKEHVEYEQKYKQYENTPQPKITAIDAEYDMYPESGNADISGKYTLKNKTDRFIDTLIFSKDEKRITQFKISVANKQVINDDRLGFYMYTLDKPIAPGDSIYLNFTFKHKTNGFSKGGVDVVTNKNGSFIYNNHMPNLGYQTGFELSKRTLRKKHNLPVKQLEYKRDSKKGLASNFITDDADFIRLNLKLSTSADQIAVGPGYCIKEWSENGRNYYIYKSDVPVISYFAVLSARYQVKEETWLSNNSEFDPVKIKIYYHKGHEYNLDNIIDGVKLSLSYYSERFCKYPHPEIKIVEFPRFASFAQSFPAMIPFSEGLGFIADLRKENEEESFKNLKIDYPLWVTAHEMAHQWLAHHVIAADTEGAQMLMEALTQFSSLMVIKERYGNERLKKFLREELFSYNSYRKNESFEEQPLATVHGHQSAIYYKKGVITLNAINEYLGENKLIGLIGNFINKHKFKGAPYPTTVDFINELKAVTPDSLLYTVEDWVEKIAFYKFEVKEAIYDRDENLQYSIKLTIDANKYYADGKGKEADAVMNDYIEIGVFNKKGKVIHSKKYKLTNGETTITIPLKRKPSNVIIDPNYLLITKGIEKASSKVSKAEVE